MLQIQTPPIPTINSDIKMLLFTTCSAHLELLSGVYKLQNASTFITRLRVALDSCKMLHSVDVYEY
jgi:hypothetical protein